MPLDLIVASASPRRLGLLRALGLLVRPRPSGLAEDEPPGVDPAELVRALAGAKARRIAGAIREPEPPALVLGADTVVVLDGEILGKPGDDDEARIMLRRLAGRGHLVHTGVHLLRSDDGREASLVETTRVRFRELDAATVDWYVGTGEPRDKAGGYGIQGQGVLLVDSIEGSWSNVVGLPLERLPRLFAAVGVDLLERLRR